MEECIVWCMVGEDEFFIPDYVFDKYYYRKQNTGMVFAF